MTIFLHLGRPVAIDWALPKKDFQDDTKEEEEGTEVQEIKIEDDTQDEDVKFKPEPEDADSGLEDEDDVKFVNPYDSMGVDIKDEDGDKKINIRKRKIKDESDDS